MPRKDGTEETTNYPATRIQVVRIIEIPMQRDLVLHSRAGLKITKLKEELQQSWSAQQEFRDKLSKQQGETDLN